MAETSNLYLLFNANEGVIKESVMKKLILAAVAASTLIAVPANAADFGRNDQRSHQVQRRDNNRQQVRVVKQVRKVQVRNVRQAQAHRWARGQRFDRRYATNYRVVNDYRNYHLQAPPRGYQYVRSNNDIVLVAIASGLIGAVFGSMF